MELHKDRRQRFQRRSLVHSLELHNLSRMEQPSQRRNLVLHRKDRMLQRHSLVHKRICKKACSSIRKAWL